LHPWPPAELLGRLGTDFVWIAALYTGT
jgi:hypothetical protein